MSTLSVLCADLMTYWLVDISPSWRAAGRRSALLPLDSERPAPTCEPQYRCLAIYQIERRRTTCRAPRPPTAERPVPPRLSAVAWSGAGGPQPGAHPLGVLHVRRQR